MKLRDQARRGPAAATLARPAGAAGRSALALAFASAFPFPLAFALAFASPDSVQAQGVQGASALQLRSLAATCASCHGTAGKAVEGANVPGLAGLPAPYMAEQMRAFKTGTRTATVMHQIAKGYSEAQIEQLAAYFAAQKK